MLASVLVLTLSVPDSSAVEYSGMVEGDGFRVRMIDLDVQGTRVKALFHKALMSNIKAAQEELVTEEVENPNSFVLRPSGSSGYKFTYDNGCYIVELKLSREATGRSGPTDIRAVLSPKK